MPARGGDAITEMPRVPTEREKDRLRECAHPRVTLTGRGDAALISTEYPGATGLYNGIPYYESQNFRLAPSRELLNYWVTAN